MITVLVIALLVCVNVSGRRWDTSMLQSYPIVQNNASVEHLVGLKKLEQLDWGCLFNTDKPGHSKNKWHEIDTNRSEALKNPDFLRGNTFWINEYMSVGHMMYDIALLQTLQTVPVDRIVLQRAVCISANQCAGIGVFESFFKGLYTAMTNSYGTEIPIFFRWSWQSREMKPLYLSDKVHNNEYTVPIERRHRSFHLKSTTCMERVIRNPMRCLSCFHNSISPAAAVRFKEVAYSLVTPQSISEAPYKPLVHHFVEDGPVVVTLAHRGLSATRHMGNVPHMAHILGTHFTAPEYQFRVVDTTNMTRGYAEQIRIVADSQVVIAEHGAFQSNVIYMRNGSLLIDLKGNYSNGENRNFENLARMFGVYYAAVLTENLTDHKSQEFNITDMDCESVVSTVKQYVSEKPYAFNLS